MTHIDPAKNTEGSNQAPINPWNTVKDILLEQLKEHLKQNGFYESAWEHYWEHPELGSDTLIEENGKIFVFSLPDGMKTTVKEVKTLDDVDTLLKECLNRESI